jgi:hypothetical protein
MNNSIDPEQMRAHAKKLDELGGRITTTLGAADQTMHPEAFGLLGIPLAGICSAAQFVATSTIRSAADAALDHVKRVDRWTEAVERNDEDQANLFGGIDK